MLVTGRSRGCAVIRRRPEDPFGADKDCLIPVRLRGDGPVVVLLERASDGSGLSQAPNIEEAPAGMGSVLERVTPQPDALRRPQRR